MILDVIERILEAGGRHSCLWPKAKRFYKSQISAQPASWDSIAGFKEDSMHRVALGHDSQGRGGNSIF